MKKHIIIILTVIAIITSFWSKKTLAEDLLTQRVAGRILLQVENNGEAWYVNPIDLNRYYLGKPSDAFLLLRSAAVGISNVDIQKIPVADTNLANGVDSDQDGLSDMVEDSFGTDKNRKDSDGDGYNDKDEILKGYNPNKANESMISLDFTEKQKGKILLQAEANGEAWYVNHTDGKRYFLGRPQDAFNIMRTLGLGITNKDLLKIAEFKIDPIYSNETIVKKSTTPDKKDNSLLVYSDISKKYSFEYPKNWQIKKFKENPNHMQISDAKIDFIMEKRGVIMIDYFKTDNNIEIFAIPEKEGVKTVSDKKFAINYKNAYENSYEYPVADEKTITIEINSGEFLRISLVTGKGYIQYYKTILDKLVDSLKTSA